MAKTTGALIVVALFAFAVLASHAEPQEVNSSNTSFFFGINKVNNFLQFLLNTECLNKN